MPNEDHVIQRPLIDELFGDSQAPGTIFSEIGNRWTKEDFLSSALEFLQDKDSVVWTIKELHKRTLGIDLTDAQVQAFQGLRGASVFLAILPAAFVDIVAAQIGTTVADINQGKKAFVGIYRNVLVDLIAAGLITTELPTEDDVTKAAITILDGFIFAGGASVPSTIKSGLAAYYTGLTPNGQFDTTNPQDLGVLALETIRSYPPVLGFPYIEASTDKRQAPMPGFSGYDKGVYGGDADRFRIRGDLGVLSSAKPQLG